ncbi:phage tail tape measure protein [Nonomuraea rhizosphaerae]|uniref:phage tail tape measure protein n=1 Tax=Nonomuraea rhizosphaerae TaxID=2665663 RepID=UPI001C60440F|nr:phage tail tape measure protein [Nonomuraea rhizosphaerae]
MAMTVGELAGFIDLEDKGFVSTLQSAGQGMERLQSTTSSSTSAIESTVNRAFAEIQRDITDGLDPTQGLADIDRLVSEFGSDMDRMETEAGRGGQGIVNQLTSAFDRLDDGARADGQRAADEILNGFRDGLRDVERVARESGEDAGREFGDGVEEASVGGGGRMSGIASSLIGVLKAAPWLMAGAAIGDAIMSGIESAMDAESAKQKLIAQVGATGPQMEQLGRVAGQVYADAYGESMADVGDAIKSVVQNLDGMRDASDESLKAVTERAMDVATVMDEEVGGVTRTVSKLLRTGLAKDAEEAFDVLVRGTQLGADSSQDLLDTLNEYPTQFRDLGLTAKDALGLMMQGLKAGARDSDIVADALKEINIRVQDLTASPALQKLGLNAKEMASAFAEGGPTARKALDEILDRLRGVDDKTQRYALAQQLLGTQSEDLAKALLSLDPSSAVDALGKVDGAAKTASDTLADTAENKLTAFKRGLETNVVTFLGSTVLPKLEELGDALAKGFEMSDLGEGIQEVRDKFGEVFDGIREDVATWVSDNGELLSQLRDTFGEYFESIKGLVVEVLDGIKVFWDEWGDEILTIVTGALDFVLSAIGGFIEVLKGIFQAVKSVLTGDWQGLWNGLGSIVEGGTRGIRSLADTGMRLLGEAMGFNWDQIKARGQKGIDNLIAVVKNLPENLKKWASEAGTWLLQAGKDLINGMINGIKAKAGELVNAAKGTVQGAIDGAKNLLGIKSPSTVFHEIGTNTIQGMINGASSMGPTLNEVMAGVAHKAVSSARSAAKTQMDALSQDFAAWAAATKTQMDRLSEDFAKWKAKNAPKAVVINENQIAGMQGVDYMSSSASAMTNASGAGAATGGVNVTVDMSGSTFHEQADVDRIGADVGFHIFKNGVP